MANVLGKSTVNLAEVREKAIKKKVERIKKRAEQNCKCKDCKCKKE
jgi:hypothetical protein